MPGASISVGTKRRASEPVSQNGSPAAPANTSSNSVTVTAANSSQSTCNGSGGNGAATMNGSGSGVAADKAVMKMKADVFEKDRENFLSSFEKSTQIYRFLRARMVESPIFLQRNLSYMRSRFSRSHQGREGFKVDHILLKRQHPESDDKCRISYIPSPRSGNLNGPAKFYNIIFLGFTDGQIWLPETKARIDVCLARVSVKKRKDGNGPPHKVYEKCVDVKVFSPSAPTSSHEIAIPLLPKCPVVSVPADMCSVGTNGHSVKSYRLILRVTVPQACLQTRNFSSMSDQQSNHLNSRNSNSNNSHNNNNELEEPKAKRRRSAPTTKDRENFIYDGDTNGKTPGGAASDTEDIVIYSGTISLYERDIPGDSIREVDFDLQLKRMTRPGSRISHQRIRREVSWENFEEKHSKVLEQVKPAGKSAKVCIAIRTSDSKVAQFVEPPAPLLRAAIKREDGALNDSNMSLAKLEMRRSVRVIYQFMYGNNSQQQTESHDDLRCPWCSLNCMLLYSLMKHLKLCHPRYQFTYAPIPHGAKIDVTLNDSYDGSYTGSAFDLVTQPPGEAFARNGPTKRTEVFSILVCRPKPIRQSLQEFFDCDEKDVDQRRTYITGHNSQKSSELVIITIKISQFNLKLKMSNGSDGFLQEQEYKIEEDIENKIEKVDEIKKDNIKKKRLYHHTSTCLPIHPREIDVDSEGEPDPEWLRVKTTMMIDEFTDVNEGEKELMKLWNLHVMKYNYVGDCQIPLACKRFVEYHGKELIQKNLYRNLCLHLTNLFDFGLLTPHGVHTTIQLLHSQMKESNSAPSLRENWKVAQVNKLHPIRNGGVNGTDTCASVSMSPTKSFMSINTPSSSNATTLNNCTGGNVKTVPNCTASSATQNTANNVNGYKTLEIKMTKLSTPPGAVVSTRNISKN
ncbi:Polycomb protein suz12-A [Orchesella cincta]|uniref:Polycomb protein suz12-A n=1 Tax=Orchesella cincta TaxID=48709 RepID=A0A1D2MSJ5_ORCCI|nr:Polycomb protein suz12-A [Orchesella cincta]